MLFIAVRKYQYTVIMQAEKYNILLLLGRMKTTNLHYGKYLRALRQEAGLTQVDLAKRLVVAQSNIAFWERSAKPPRSDVLKPLAEALNVSLERLLKSEPFEPTRPIVQGKLAKAFGKASGLPRRQQEKIAEVVDALVEKVASY